MTNPEREKAIEGICQRTGKTREQAVAFLDVLGSGLTKRGLADAKVLTEDETAERVRTFIGEPLSQRRRTTYCDECQLWLPCHKYDAGYRAEEVLYLCDECVLEVQP